MIFSMYFLQRKDCIEKIIMTSASGLKEKMAQTLGLTRAWVNYVDRDLALANLREHGGGGRSPRPMNSSDAATSTIALGLSAQNRGQAIAAVQSAKQVPRKFEEEPLETKKILIDCGFVALSVLKPRHTFFEAIVAIFEDARTGALKRTCEEGTRLEIRSRIGGSYSTITVQSGDIECVMYYAPDGSWNRRFERKHRLEAVLTEAEIIQIGEAL